MKKILLICTLFISLAATAQFPTRDSLRTYINKWVRNSAVESFTNMRLNTSLNGMINFLDSGGAGGSSNNANVGGGFKLAIPGTRNIKSITKGYGVLLDSASSNQLNIKADSNTIYTFMRGHVADNSHITQAISYSEAKAINVITKENYFITINDRPGYFKVDNADSTSDDDTAMVIVTNAGKRLKRIVDDALDVRWFGAIPDDNIDDWYNLQRCINYAIYNNYKKIRFPGGQFDLSKGLLVWKDANNDGDPEFINISIEGNQNAYSGTSQKETVLYAKNRNSFALGIMRGKGCEVRNINFFGTNQVSYSTAQAWGGSQTYILDSQRTNAYSPYAGLVLDPFGSSTGGSDRYPGFESYYAGVVGNGGSTDCKFYNIVTNGFIVGVILTPNGNTQNNESHVFDGLWMTNCREGFVTTNSQERQVLVRNFKAWSNVKTVFQTTGYGASRGEPPNIDGGNIAGNVYQIFNFSGVGGYFPVISVRNIYGESFYRIGAITAYNIGFKDCHFALGITSNYGVKTPDWIFYGSTVTFDNCMILYYNGGYATPMNFAVNGYVKFNNCYLSNPVGLPFTQWTNNNPQVSYSNCRFYARYGFITDGYVWSEFTSYRSYSGNYGRYIDLGDINVTYSHGERFGIANSAATQFRRVESKMKKWISLGTVSVTVAGDTASATIASLAGKSQFVNAIVFDLGELNEGGQQCMRIKSIDGSGNVKFDRVVNRLASGSMQLWIEDYQQLGQPILFDYNGTTMTNIKKETDTGAHTLDINKVYYYATYPVVATSASAGTATPSLTAPALAPFQSPIKRGILSNYEYTEYGYSYGDPLTNGYFTNGVMFTEGAVYTNTKTTGADSLVYGYRCKKSGILGSTLAPEFEVIYKAKSSGSGYKLASETSNQIKSLSAGYGITLDSATTGQVGIKIDSATVYNAKRKVDTIYAYNDTTLKVVINGSTRDVIIKGKGATTSITSGYYTPTKYQITNVDSANVNTCYYQRIGDYIYVFGEVYIDPTSSNQDTQVELSLPVTTYISNSYNLAGNGSSDAVGEAVRIYGNTNNDRAVMRYKSSDSSGHTFSFTFIYIIGDNP